MQPTVPEFQSDEMHACDLVEVAIRVVEHAREIVESPMSRQPDMEAYWSNATCRFSRWGTAFREIAAQDHTAAEDVAQGKDQIEFEEITPEAERARTAGRALLEEIFISEPLTRVWAACLVARDRYHDTDNCESIVRTIAEKHAEFSHRALNLIADQGTLDWKSAVQLNRLRRRSERWGDVLIARLNDLAQDQENLNVNEFAFDESRAADFATDFGENSNPKAHQTAWNLAVTSLRSGVSSARPASPNADLNFQIAWNVVSAFDADTFEATGPFRSLWLHRLDNHTDQAQELVDEYLTHMA